jgi:4a-hydroxytetrahydrobiopterin dehydratase
MTGLSEDRIVARLAELSGWTRDGKSIRKTFTFGDFKGSMAFVTRVALAAERMDHHPDMFVSYSRVTLTLSTHDAGGLTDRDFDLAKIVDA